MLASGEIRVRNRISPKACCPNLELDITKSKGRTVIGSRAISILTRAHKVKETQSSTVCLGNEEVVVCRMGSSGGVGNELKRNRFDPVGGWVLLFIAFQLIRQSKLYSARRC